MDGTLLFGDFMHGVGMSDPLMNRHKTVHALSWNLLEAELIKSEAEGWRRVGGVALAQPVSPSSPCYWAQRMSKDPVSTANLPPDQPRG